MDFVSFGGLSDKLPTLYPRDSGSAEPGDVGHVLVTSSTAMKGSPNLGRTY